MAINRRPRQLIDRGFPACAQAIVRSHDPRPGPTPLEITEGALIREPGTAARRLDELRRYGVRVAVDDFGTGYSAFAYLQQFPIDILKIDRTFVKDMLTRPGLSLAGAMIQIARALELEPIAEGGENQAQADAIAAPLTQ